MTRSRKNNPPGGARWKWTHYSAIHGRRGLSGRRPPRVIVAAARMTPTAAKRA